MLCASNEEFGSYGHTGEQSRDDAINAAHDERADELDHDGGDGHGGGDGDDDGNDNGSDDAGYYGDEYGHDAHADY